MKKINLITLIPFLWINHIQAEMDQINTVSYETIKKNSVLCHEFQATLYLQYNPNRSQEKRCRLIKQYLESESEGKIPQLLEYPVIFVHGFLGGYKHTHGYFIKEPLYFDGVQEIFRPFIKKNYHLKKDAQQMVFQPSLSSAESEEVRGQELLHYIKAVLKYTKKDKVHLIGHSQGALTARYAAGELCNNLDSKEKCPILSVASIAGVNYGSTIADFFWRKNMAVEERDLLMPYYEDVDLPSGLYRKFWTGAPLLNHTISKKYKEDPFRKYIHDTYHKKSKDADYIQLNQDSRRLSKIKYLSYFSLLDIWPYKYNQNKIKRSIKQLSHPEVINIFNKKYPHGVIQYESLEDRVNLEYNETYRKTVHPSHKNFDLDSIQSKHIQANGIFYASWAGYKGETPDLNLKGHQLIEGLNQTDLLTKYISYGLIKDMFKISASNEDQKYYQMQQYNDGLVANIDSMLGIDFGAYEGFNHSTIVNNYEYYFKNKKKYFYYDAHQSLVDKTRQRLDYSNPEYLYLKYLRIMSLVEAHLKDKMQPEDNDTAYK